MNIKKSIIAFLTLSRKEITRIIRIWIQTLLPSTTTITLYFVIFGTLIGPRIGKMSGMEYTSFIVPGLIMMAVINNSYANVSSSFFSAKLLKSLEELVVSPMQTWTIINGYISGGIFRGIAVGILAQIVSLFFTELHIYNIFIIACSIVLTSTLFSLIGLINAVFAKSFDHISIIPTFILTPLTYLGGVFYTIDMLPTLGQIISYINPIVYMVNTFRYGMLGISDISLTVAFSMTVFLVIITYSVAYYLVKKGVGIKS